ncbi:conserved protein of unknown function [Pseudodesulfovibrio profundus]|uniref:histidine kinase n=1 Tax=Pseudodesulfovibrio profundus TaxID=57320 RepID=A0A2C8FCZ7_9BACT|nr:HAMP domain-containing histidine kinase [Pseudodesulfovibrio profundus]MBC16916.1 histidine kinase [Desulfovibrio sp.]SOB60366.1 conserved protein of unknown function [Pseudodesulfovibrio profundus]|tara:strand:- start:12389 stop:13039 length:651 start_codon:yes stop_codon:yes gene_type:complete
MDEKMSTQHEGLQFFGRVSASVSHEIKNVFAVINEASGLIEDFTRMAERGMPIQPERLRKAANAIQGQVQRGDRIVKNMNAFAHSTDEPVREVDLVETLGLVVALTSRLADMKQVRLTTGVCEPVSQSANPFDLLRLLHSSIAATLETMSAGDTLAIGVKPVDDGASFSLSIPGKDAPSVTLDSFSSLAQAMNASLSKDEANSTCELLLPAARGSV